MIGKPYSGKPNVRFDEGELEIELLATTPALYSTVLAKFYYQPAPKISKRKFHLVLPETLKTEICQRVEDYNQISSDLDR